jgi:hypothetical protein
LSRNPPHYNTLNTTNLRQRDQITVNAIDLNIDNTVKSELTNLAVLQNTDPRLQSIKEGLTTHSTTGTKYVVNNDVIYCKEDKEDQNWMAMLPECLQYNFMKYVHTTLGHLGSDKCYTKIKDNFHLRNLGRKLRKSCDLCQRTKHMNTAYGVTERPHLPQRPGKLCAVDLINIAGKRQIHLCMLRRVL